MGSGIFFPISALPIILIIIAIFYIRGHIANEETKIFNWMIIANLIGLIIEILCAFACRTYETYPLISAFVLKTYLVYLIVWTALFTIYIFRISFDNKHTKIKTVHFILLPIILLIIYILPINVVVKNNYQVFYTNGLSVSFSYLVSFIYVIAIIVILLLNINKIKTKKYLPVLLFFVIGTISIVIQMKHPELLLLTYSETLICLSMFFTIENPDVKMLEQVELAKDQAEKANRAKTDFLSSMSHEIRTPLNAIVGFSECIEDAQTMDEAKENAHDIVNASQTLLEIVNGILDISKIEAGKVEIVNSPYNAKEVFENLAVLITPKMNEKGLDFTYSIAPDLPQTLYGDHANIKKIVTNLLSNAAKYTEHGFVRYEVHCVNSGKYSKLIITVEDSGRGIKKDSVDKLFTKFQRLDEDKNTTIEGTGLGMAITKQLIELMGGKILIHTIYGEGSKFTVVINQRIEEEEQVAKHHQLDTLDLNNVKLLLVDDNALNIKVATKILEKYNANMITSVVSGFDCLDKVKSGEKYDVILLDDMMPKMSGIETLNELKKIPGFKTPVVALTANAITGMKEKYLNEGFNGYLGKPIEKDQLIKVMNEILGRNITNQIPVEEIKEETKEEEPEEKPEEEKSLEDDKNRIIQVSEDDVDLLKNQKLVSETTQINILDHDLDKVSVVKENTEDSGEVLDIEEEPEEEKDTSLENTAPIDLPTVEEPPSITPEEYLRNKGVDLDKALENLGDMEMYDATVEDFLSEVEEKWQRIEDYKLQNNMKDYSIEVHSLKSDAKYLGLMRLADIAYQHELASKEERSDYVNNNFNYLEDEYQKALDIIKNYKETILK